ncbi:MAG: APC family permease [Actinomycetota bacterium]
MAARAEDKVMISEKVAPVLVARTLRPFDLVVIFVSIVLFINNAAGLQFAGPSVFIFWIVAFLTFLITGAFVTAQLGRMFPEEGSLYVWTHKVLGPFWGFFAGFVAWWPGPIVMVAAGTLVAAYIQQVAAFSDNAILTENWQIGIVVLLVVWFSAAMSLLRMRLTQNYVNVQFYFYAAAIFVIGLAGVWWLLDGNAASTDFGAGWDPFQGEELALGIPANLTFFSFAILALLGIETPLNMGVEVSGGERAIRTYLLWGCLIVMAAYLWTTWGNMVVIEAGGANGVTGGAEAVGIAIGEWAGVIVALILAWVFLTATVVYNYAFARLLFVSGLEKRLPHQVGQVNRNQVPANAVILQTAIATIITIVVFFGLGGEDPNKPFYGLYAGLTIVWCISTALLFLDIFFARRADPERFERERRVPLGFLYACGVVGTIVNLLAVLFIFIGSWYPAGFPTLAEWNAWMIVITAVSVIAGIVIYAISQRTRRGKTDVELLVEIPEVEPARGGGGA